MKQKRRGIALAIMSAITFGIMPFMTKLLYTRGGNPISIPFYRNLFVLIVLGIAVIVKRQSVRLPLKTCAVLFIASFFALHLTTLFLFIAYYSIPSGMATTLHFLYPILVSIGSVIILRRANQSLKYLALLLSVIGIALLFDLSTKANWQGIVLSFLSAVTYAIYILIIEFSILKTLEPLVVAFYLNLFATVTFGIHGTIEHALSINYSASTWLLLIVFALAVGIAGSIFMQLAIGYIGGQSAAILSTFEPITSIVVGAFVLAEKLTLKMLSGMALIIIAALIVIVLEGNSKTVVNGD